MRAEILIRTAAELEKTVIKELNNEDKDLGEIENEITQGSNGGRVPPSGETGYGNCEVEIQKE
jgi:hypothetical protein